MPLSLIPFTDQQHVLDPVTLIPRASVETAPGTFMGA
jgi:hypothetical protein